MKLIIEIDGGCISEVYADSPDKLEIEIVDRDCEKIGDKFRFSHAAEPLSKFEP